MDSSELILSKENIQPLRHGRDTSKLCVALQAQSDNDADRKLQQQRLEYETLLRDDSITDPMEVWYNYMHWLEQSFPSQTHKANINGVLKKCINKFKQNEKYKNDERFVKICLKYATINDATADTFGLLYSCGIGVKCAIFYIAWAEWFAMSNSLKKAARVYEKGINQLAQPIDLLKEAQRTFMAFFVKKSLDSGLIFEPTSEVYETGPARQAYNKLRIVGGVNKQVVPSVRVGENVTAPGKFVVSKPVQKSNVPNIIYEDEADNEIEVNALTKVSKLKSYTYMTKENQKKAGKWTNSDKKNVPFSVPSIPLPFQVHVDEKEADSKPVRPTAQLTSALKAKQPNDEFNVDYADTPLFWAEPYDPTVKPMYRKEQVYAGGLEFQFEELRAINYRRRKPEQSLVKQGSSTPGTTPCTIRQQCVNDKVLPSAESITLDAGRVESLKKNLALQQAPQEPLSKPRVIYDSGRKSMKIRPGEEARSARRKIALPGEEADKRTSHSARKSAQSKFAGVVRRTLVLDQLDPCAMPKPDVPSDSFINQTIHTKEAVNEMQELWFAKPATPREAKVKPQFTFYVDESCLGKEGCDSRQLEAHKTPFGLPHSASTAIPADEHDKENAIPSDYAGPTSKSVRPVTGVLTPAENVPFEPINEEEDEEQVEEENSVPEAPGNTTGITETWNFTQAFTFPKIIHASTPNVRRSVFRPPPSEETSLLETQSSDGRDCEKRVDLKMNTPSVAEEPQRDVPERSEIRKNQQRGVSAEQRTLGEVCAKNLSIIIETSREYKSSSSGSGGSACSKLLPFTPGESRSEARFKRSYYQSEESRKTPFASNMQSTYGYEASGELSCTGTKSVTDRFSSALKLATEVKSTVEPTDEVSKSSVVNAVHETLMNKDPLDNNEICVLPTTNADNERVPSPAVNVVEDVDPFDTRVIDLLLEEMNFPSGHHEPGCNFVHSKLPPLKINSHIQLGCSSFEVKKVLGEGAYAKIFKVQEQQTGNVKVLKYQKPAFLWEFYICREIHARCPDNLLASYYMTIEEGYFFNNASILVSSPVEYGDLLTAINLYKVNQGKPMSDFLALYFTVQILEIIETLHSLKIIHGDIKPDNFLVKKLNGKLTLELIDFGRSIDMTLFPKGTTFTRVVTTEGLTCVEMQSGRPWTYQLDLYGVAGCVHCLLFGDYMKVVQKSGVWDISKVIPRYLAKSGWKQLFQSLLNIPSCEEMPNLSELRGGLNDKLQAYGPQPDILKLTNFLQNR